VNILNNAGFSSAMGGGKKERIVSLNGSFMSNEWEEINDVVAQYGAHWFSDTELECKRFGGGGCRC
jgi:hypothetical protein